MLTDTAEWHLAVILPDSVCTDELWVDNWNVGVVVALRDLSLLSDLHNRLIEPDCRRENLVEYIGLHQHSTLAATLFVQMYSPLLRIKPLVLRNSSSIKFVDPWWLLPVGERSADGIVNCPMHLISDTVAIAVFVLDPADSAQESASHRPTIHAWLMDRGLVAGEVVTEVRLTDMADPGALMATGGIYQRIFACYAREDRSVVECVESVLQNLGLGELRWDLRVLRAGMDWASAVFNEIDSADSFQLFWSENSRKSDSVRREWQHALRLERPRFIKPVYWNDPLPQPPSEIQHLHFGRIFVGGQVPLELEQAKLAPTYQFAEPYYLPTDPTVVIAPIQPLQHGIPPRRNP